MTVTREDLNPCTVKLNVVCSVEQVKEGFDRAYKEASKRVKIPGFRPGTAPRAVVEKNVDIEWVHEAAADQIVRSTLKKALKDESIEPFVTPQVSLEKLEKDTSECVYTAQIGLRPVVELGDYRALQAQRPVQVTTDEEVEQYVDELRQKKSTREAVTDRGVAEGDVAVVNIKVDGEEGDGRTFMTIAGKTFEGLDHMLLGMRAEDMKSADLEFPESFQEKDWAGKKFHCQVTVRSVSAVKMPSLDDNFAQEYGQMNIDELRGRIRELFDRAKNEQAQQLVNEQLMDNLLSISKIHVPDSMWEQVAQQRLEDVFKEQKEAGKTMEQFATENGMTVEQFVDAVRREAKLYVERAQAIQTIFVTEKMKLTNDDVKAELLSMSAEFRTTPDELLTLLKKNDAMQELTHRAINTRVMDFLNSHATISSEAAPAAAAAEAPKPKAPAKKKATKKAE
jgi:trigger factor